MQKEIRSPVKAIRAKCRECKGNSPRSVDVCETTECPLHAFRMGKNPYLSRAMTPEQREAAAERLRKAREKQ